MKMFLSLVVVAVLAVHFLVAQTDDTKQTNLTKEKQNLREKKSNDGIMKVTSRNKGQTAQFSAGFSRPTNIQQLSNISSNMKVSSNIQQTGKKASFKLPNGIHLPAEVPTGIPADAVGKATKQLKDRFRKTERHKLIADYIRLKRVRMDAKAEEEMETKEQYTSGMDVSSGFKCIDFSKVFSGHQSVKQVIQFPRDPPAIYRRETVQFENKAIPFEFGQ